VSADLNEYKVTRLITGENYLFKVRAENDFGLSEPLISDEEITAKNPFGNSNNTCTLIMFVNYWKRTNKFRIIIVKKQFSQLLYIVPKEIMPLDADFHY